MSNPQTVEPLGYSDLEAVPIVSSLEVKPAESGLEVTSVIDDFERKSHPRHGASYSDGLEVARRIDPTPGVFKIKEILLFGLGFYSCDRPHSSGGSTRQAELDILFAKDFILRRLKYPPYGYSTLLSGPKVIKHRSPLAVTSWRTGSEYRIRLVHQEGDNMVREFDFDSRSNNWSAPVDLFQGEPTTPLAVASFVPGNFYSSNKKNNYQSEVISLSNTCALQHIGRTTNYTAANTSNIAMWWPHIWYLDASNLFQHHLALPSGQWPQAQEPSGFTGLSGTSLAIIPRYVNGSGLSIFYQREDPKLIEYHGGTTMSSAPTVLKGGLARTVFAAFALPRDDVGDETNMYLLYQETFVSTDIQARWLDDATGWKGLSTFGALQEADGGTKLACVGSAEAISVDRRVCRCFFQVRVRVVVQEVGFSKRGCTIASDVVTG